MGNTLKLEILDWSRFKSIEKNKKYDQSFPFNECNLSKNPIKIAYLSVKMTEPTKDLSQ